MSDARSPDRDGLTRRAVVSGICAAGAATLGSTAAAHAQDGTATEAGAQLTRTAVVPAVGEPFAGNYVGQFVILTDPTPREDVTATIVEGCDAADWAPEESLGYQVLIADRLSDDPRGVSVEAFLDASAPPIELGNAFIVNRTHPCAGDAVVLDIEAVPVRRFNPRYGEGGGLVGASPGPTLSPTGGTADVDAPGQPGFGALAAMVGVGIAAWVRRLRRS